MAKPNINVATREELVDVAGLRPDLADEIEALLSLIVKRLGGEDPK